MLVYRGELELVNIYALCSWGYRAAERERVGMRGSIDPSSSFSYINSTSAEDLDLDIRCPGHSCLLGPTRIDPPPPFFFSTYGITVNFYKQQHRFVYDNTASWIFNSEQTMIREYWIFIIGLGLVAALSSVPHQTTEESLRSALNAVTRKQRSLNSNAQDFYVDLPALDIRELNAERKSRRQQVGSEDFDDNDDALAFIPSGSGQMETIGDGYQHLNNKQLGRVLMDYLQYETDQEAAGSSRPQTSVFRERVRTGSRKRTGNLDSPSIEPRINGREQLIRLLLGLDNEVDPDESLLAELQPAAAQNYRRILQTVYDKYGEQGDGPYGPELSEAAEQMLLSKLAEEDNDEGNSRPSAKRRNVNARYPLYGQYDSFMAKRSYPLSKRSAKAGDKNSQSTDPKVAQDLGGLFGDAGKAHKLVNQTREQHTAHDGHAHGSEEHKHEHAPSVGKKEVSEASANKTSKERPIEVRKKSIDWSQYFGIDRRKKKTVYAAKPGTQDQDDEYLLQKYYEIMAENLSPLGKLAGEKREKLQRQLNYAKSRNRLEPSLTSQQFVQLGLKNDMDNQQVNDEMVSRLATAYSLEKLRRALNELGSSRSGGSAVSSKPQQKLAQTGSNNLTSINLPTNMNSVKQMTGNKRRDSSLFANADRALEFADEGSDCPQLERIESRCRASGALVGDYRQMLLGPCIAYHVCNSCEEDGCLERFVLESEMICMKENFPEESSWTKVRCMQAALSVTRYPPVSSLCRPDEANLHCLAEYQNRYPHPYLYGAAYQNNLRKRRYASTKR